MSIPFSSTTNKNGIIQLIERNCGFSDGDISGNATYLAQFTADINLALDKAVALILKSAGTWDFDDSNFTDYPFLTTNIVSGQRDYAFTSDASGNLILEMKRVMVKDVAGTYHEIYPVDQETPTTKSGNAVNTDSFINGLNASGVPTRYDKTGNGIFLDVIPNYNSTAGLKIMVDREASYFLTNDTTKKAGFAGIFHEYLALRPSYQYAYRNSRANMKSLQDEMLKMERDIQDYYNTREKDTVKKMTPNVEDNR